MNPSSNPRFQPDEQYRNEQERNAEVYEWCLHNPRQYMTVPRSFSSEKECDRYANQIQCGLIEALRLPGADLWIDKDGEVNPARTTFGHWLHRSTPKDGFFNLEVAFVPGSRLLQPIG